MVIRIPRGAVLTTTQLEMHPALPNEPLLSIKLLNSKLVSIDLVDLIFDKKTFMVHQIGTLKVHRNRPFLKGHP